ncbi:sodium- and chloride-dependent glycine transporter 2-like [Mizuhopecten yessoensis]|uniref:sodium- and chloride-dependent glycine transporter 2-like n=1 Tax=Mizuhopecten yessoensis TaxID=6573 RepID=UPI000B4580CC|nr:sodium- and chloride-dependent glycine transporter 2-like [Mizuhopecten yessoensis]
MANTSAVNVKWTSRVEFIVALLGYSIGMPEFWRVPYLTYRNGGGPFIIAYILLMLVCGLPLYFLELALSQFSGKGPWRFWDICPLLRGMGIAIAVINALSAVNTAIMGAWSIEYQILRISDGIDYLGTISVVFVAYLFVLRLLAAISIVKSVESMGKMLYVTALLPVVLIVMIWIRALTLPGSTKGMLYFVSADFRRFADPQLWIEASFQTFITLGPGWGGLMMMGAHNKFRTNCFQSSVISTSATLTFGLLNGLVVFSVLGVMSEEINVPIPDLMTSGGFSIGFIAYPKALSYFPLPQLWCAIFYLVLLLPGLDAMAILTEPLLMIFEEMFPKMLNNRRIPLLTVVSVVMFLAGLPFATQFNLTWQEWRIL